VRRWNRAGRLAEGGGLVRRPRLELVGRALQPAAKPPLRVARSTTEHFDFCLDVAAKDLVVANRLPDILEEREIRLGAVWPLRAS
jgi:hypothetical protein